MGDTLNIQFLGAPIAGLDPALLAGGGQSVIYSSLAYDSLLFQQPDGTIVPDLATSWEFIDDENKVLELTIREGVKFSDGEDLTPDAVVKYLEYFQSAKGIRNYQLAAMTSAVASGDKVTITLSSSNPDLPLLLTQTYGSSFIVSPKALEDPEALSNSTAGTGPFIYDPSASVVGDHYTYVRNKDYWNPDAIHYNKVVVRSVADPNTVLSAVQSGQINVALGDASTAENAKSAGIEVLSAAGGNIILYLSDRDGTSVEALGNESVRQAINYAIDRESIVKALYPNGFATPTSQIATPQQAGFSAANDARYPYDLAKAKRLLTEAGYPNGFSFTAMCSPVIGNCNQAQAVAASLSEAGIDMQIDQESQIPAFQAKFAGAQVPATFFAMGDSAFLSAQQWLPTDSFQNAFKTQDSELDAAYASLSSATSSDAKAAAATSLTDRVLTLAWFAPLVRTDQLVYVKGVEGVSITDANPVAYSPVDPTGETSWRPAN